MGTLGTLKASGSVRLVRTTTRLPFKERRERGREGLSPSFLPSFLLSSSSSRGLVLSGGRKRKPEVPRDRNSTAKRRERGKERRPEMAAARREEEEEEEDVEAARSPTSSISSGGSRRGNLPRGRFILGEGGGKDSPLYLRNFTSSENWRKRVEGRVFT